jgi:hypothetical protein
VTLPSTCPSHSKHRISYPFHCLRRTKVSGPVKFGITTFVFTVELLALRPTLKLNDHSLSAVRDPLFNTFLSYGQYLEPFRNSQPEDTPHSNPLTVTLNRASPSGGKYQEVPSLAQLQTAQSASTCVCHMCTDIQSGLSTLKQITTYGDDINSKTTHTKNTDGW